ncbi:hypothetical protein BC567DRAFT_6039 [Phyllosticta citribraziliensis]
MPFLARCATTAARHKTEKDRPASATVRPDGNAAQARRRIELSAIAHTRRGLSRRRLLLVVARSALCACQRAWTNESSNASCRRHLCRRLSCRPGHSLCRLGANRIRAGKVSELCIFPPPSTDWRGALPISLDNARRVVQCPVVWLRAVSGTPQKCQTLGMPTVQSHGGGGMLPTHN